jgi:hypothetical protein
VAKSTKPNPTVILVFKFKGAVQHKQLFVNDVDLTFVAGRARFSVDPKKDYRLRLVVKGFGGTKCSYTLAAESEGFAVKPKTLSDPGRKFEMSAPKETKTHDFTVVKTESGSEV